MSWKHPCVLVCLLLVCLWGLGVSLILELFHNNLPKLFRLLEYFCLCIQKFRHLGLPKYAICLYRIELKMFLLRVRKRYILNLLVNCHFYITQKYIGKITKTKSIMRICHKHFYSGSFFKFVTNSFNLLCIRF